MRTGDKTRTKQRRTKPGTDAYKLPGPGGMGADGPRRLGGAPGGRGGTRGMVKLPWADGVEVGNTQRLSGHCKVPEFKTSKFINHSSRHPWLFIRLTPSCSQPSGLEGEGERRGGATCMGVSPPRVIPPPQTAQESGDQRTTSPQVSYLRTRPPTPCHRGLVTATLEEAEPQGAILG